MEKYKGRGVSRHTMTKKLAETMNIEDADFEEDPKTVEEPVINNLPAVVEAQEVPDEEIKEAKDDYNFSRKVYKGIISRGEEAVEGMLNLAEESDSARAYEVVATLIKSVSDATGQLTEMHLKRKAYKKVDGRDIQSQITVDKAVFVGTPEELLSRMRNKEIEAPDKQSDNV